MIVVTGGAGFIGSNIVHGLNNLGITDILIVDDLTDGHKSRNLNAVDFIDYIDKDDFLANIDRYAHYGVHTIFHQGACADTMEHNGKKMMQMNYEYSKSLFDFSMRHDIRFLYASSAAVYGNGENGFIEDRACENPLNVYAYSKFLFDQYVRCHLHNLPAQTVGLRYFNVYGQQENHKARMASTVFHFFHQLHNDGVAKLFEGSEHFIRDFIYVNDVVAVNLFFFNNPEKSGIFNCGTGKASSFTSIATTLIELEKKGVIQSTPFPDALKGKYQAFTQADTTALRAIGFEKSFTPLAEGIRSYYDFLANNDGFLRRTQIAH